MLFRKSHLTLTALLSAILGLAVVCAPVEAKWFSKKQKQQEAEAIERVRTFQPPPENAPAIQCEPYRKEAVVLSQKNWLVRPFYGPRRTWLIRKHQKCTQRLMDQEFLYLKNVDIQQPPSLPKLKTDEGVPVAPPPEDALPEKGGANPPLQSTQGETNHAQPE